MKKRICAAAAALCLLLTACGGGRREQETEELSLSEALTGLEEDMILLTVDGREVPVWRYLYWLAWACEGAGEMAAEPEKLKETALADAALYATVENWAEAHGCVVEKAAEESALPSLGFSQEQIQELEEVGRKYAWLYRQYLSGESTLSPAEEDLRAYGEERGAMTVDRILVPEGDDREKAKEQAAALFSRLNGAEDVSSVFPLLAAEGADNAGPRTVFPGDEDLAPELLEAAKALSPGQCSGILESEEGFSILWRLETDTAALKEPYFDALLLTAAEDAVVISTAEYEELDAEEICNKWQEKQEKKLND